MIVRYQADMEEADEILHDCQHIEDTLNMVESKSL